MSLSPSTPTRALSEYEVKGGTIDVADLLQSSIMLPRIRDLALKL